MAIESARIRADIVEATEYPDLVARYAVRGVPKTIVNDRLFIDGAVPEAELLAAVTQATAAAAPEGSS
jgi:predicted DsbA family dithiol-disulfide isomerase